MRYACLSQKCTMIDLQAGRVSKMKGTRKIVLAAWPHSERRQLHMHSQGMRDCGFRQVRTGLGMVSGDIDNKINNFGSFYLSKIGLAVAAKLNKCED